MPFRPAAHWARGTLLRAQTPIAVAVIPNNPSRARKYPLDRHLYAQRHLIECCFSKLKQFRCVATHFEKTARNYRAVVTLAAIVLWFR
jgi:transposase